MCRLQFIRLTCSSLSFYYILLMQFCFCRYTFLSCHLDKQNKRKENEGKVVVTNTRRNNNNNSNKQKSCGTAKQKRCCYVDIFFVNTSNKYEYNLGIGTRNIFQSNDIFLFHNFFFTSFVRWSRKNFASVFYLIFTILFTSSYSFCSLLS